MGRHKTTEHKQAVTISISKAVWMEAARRLRHKRAAFIQAALVAELARHAEAEKPTIYLYGGRYGQFIRGQFYPMQQPIDPAKYHVETIILKGV